jgi:hypothetical protein
METTVELAYRMIENDAPRNDYFQKCADAYHCVYELPEELKGIPWIHKHVSQKLHNSIAGGVKALATKRAKIKKYPYLPDTMNKDKANEDERNLEWQLRCASQLRSNKMETDFVESAMLYLALGAMVIDIDWQIKQAKALNMDVTAMERARRISRFAVNLYNPMHLHEKRSVYGTDTVLLAYKRRASEVISEWGEKNIPQDIKDIAESKEDAIYYYDMFNNDTRGVWLAKELKGEPYWIMREEEHELDFIPWVTELEGSGLEDSVADKFHSMPYSLIKSGALETQHVMGTLMFTEAIASSVPAKFALEGYGTGEVNVDAMDPLGVVDVPDGKILKPIPRQELDRALAELYDRTSVDVQSATISEVLLGGQLPSGTAFSTLNLATQTAIGQLKPYKELAEKGIAGVARLMLMWTRHTEEPLSAYGMTDRVDIGETYTIEPDEIDPTGIYIEAELIPTKVTDDVAMWNATTMANRLGLPKEYGLEEAGIDDPQEALKIWESEKIDEQLFEEWKQKRMIEIQMQAQQAQMAQQAQAMQAQQAQQQQAQQMAPEQAAYGEVPGGQGFDTQAGGTPPIQANPPENQLRPEEPMV